MANYTTSKKISALVPAAHHDNLPLDTDKALAELAQVFNCDETVVRRFAQCITTLTECTPKIQTCMPKIDNACEELKELKQKFADLCNVVETSYCPANVLYSARTTSKFSSHNNILFSEIVTGLGGDYVDTFPVATGKRVKKRVRRPGYCPSYLRGDFNLANNANNYSDIQLQLYISGEAHGSAFYGNQLLMKSGNELQFEFPPFDGKPIIIGSLDYLDIDIINNGPNNIESANIFVINDAQRWYRLCGPGAIGSCSTC